MISKLNYLKVNFWWLWLCFVFVVSVIPSQETETSSWLSNFQLDKLFHLLSHAIAIFSALLALTTKQAIKKRNIIITFSVISMIIFGCFIEWVQGNYVTGRMFDLMDIAANTAGDLLGLLLFFYFDKV